MRSLRPRLPAVIAYNRVDDRTSPTIAAGDAADIDAAARVVAPFAVRTPLLSFPVLNERVGARVFLKPEMLQRTGSFKFRGAFNKLASIPQDKRGGGVVAFSSGNHAQGVAAAAQILEHAGDHRDAGGSPLSKRERTKSYGAEVVLYDRDKEDREAIASEIAGKRGATLVPPYDDPLVIAGQGTAGREIAEDMAALGLVPDIVVAPASGGGLIAGVATAVKARFPRRTVIVAEPEGYRRSQPVAARRAPRAHHAAVRTICDALMAAMPGEITFAINSQLLSGGVTASDVEVGAAVAFAYRELKLVVEPGGAIGLAALLAGRIDARARTSSSCSPAVTSTPTCSPSWWPDRPAPISHRAEPALCPDPRRHHAPKSAPENETCRPPRADLVEICSGKLGLVPPPGT